MEIYRVPISPNLSLDIFSDIQLDYGQTKSRRNPVVSLTPNLPITSQWSETDMMRGEKDILPSTRMFIPDTDAEKEGFLSIRLTKPTNTLLSAHDRDEEGLPLSFQQIMESLVNKISEATTDLGIDLDSTLSEDDIIRLLKEIAPARSHSPRSPD